MEIILGGAIVAGFVGAPILETALRREGRTLSQRIEVEGKLIAAGGIGAWLTLRFIGSKYNKGGSGWPLGNLFLFASLASLGVWSLADGALYSTALLVVSSKK